MSDDLPNFIRRVSLKCLKEQTRIDVGECGPATGAEPDHKWQSFIVSGSKAMKN